MISLAQASGLYKVGCRFVGGDNLTGALYVLSLQLSPPLPLSLNAIKLANPGSLGKKWQLNCREREMMMFHSPSVVQATGRAPGLSLSLLLQPQRFFFGDLLDTQPNLE